MKPIVTLTLNPAIDGACSAELVRPTHKIRTSDERYDPGGGGINVSRVVIELGGTSLPVYLAGGATGAVLDELLRTRGIDGRAVPIHDHTRVSHAVFERSTGREFRFVPEGPLIRAEEWDASLAALEALDFDWLVASGSRPRGIDDACYVEIAALARRKGARLVLDTSGPALKAALAAGGVFLAKPSSGEFQALVGEEFADRATMAAAAVEFVRGGGVELLAITMGHEGALLATRDGARFLAPPEVEVKSATGAGDSFTGAMVWALAEGWEPSRAFRLGVAAGSATVLAPGTDLCRRSDVWRLFEGMGEG